MAIPDCVEYSVCAHMGIASYLIYTSQASSERIQKALIAYGIQLAVNFFWSIIFFNMQAFLFAFLWLLLLWALIARQLAVNFFWSIIFFNMQAFLISGYCFFGCSLS
jgi:tryptophan-rich sensory protein